MDITTALVIIPPHEVQAIAVPLLRQYMPDGPVRLPAHITLLYPFAPLDDLPAARLRLQTCCTGIEPFPITLHDFGHFPDVVYMQILNPEPVKNLFRQINAAFPEYPPYEGRYGNDLHPHITVGKVPDDAETRAALLPDYEPITFMVNRLHVLSGVEDSALPWLTEAVVPFGNVE